MPAEREMEMNIENDFKEKFCYEMMNLDHTNRHYYIRPDVVEKPQLIIDWIKQQVKVETEVEPACERQERFGIYVSAINRIDDFFEYRYKALTPEEIKKQVMKYIDNITEQLSKSV